MMPKKVSLLSKEKAKSYSQSNAESKVNKPSISSTRKRELRLGQLKLIKASKESKMNCHEQQSNQEIYRMKG